MVQAQRTHMVWTRLRLGYIVVAMGGPIRTGTHGSTSYGPKPK